MAFEWLDEEIDINELRQLVEMKYDELMQDRDIVVLEPMDEHRRKIIRSTIKRYYEDASSFNVGRGNIRRVVLRHKVVPGYIDVGGILHDATMDYYAGDFDASLDKFFYVYNHLLRPDTFIYRMIGNSYYKKGELKKAADYYTVEELLCLEQGLYFASKDKLERIKEEISSGIANVNEEDTYNIFNYDDVKFDEVNDLILLTGMDVESACQQLGLDREMTNSVKLLYAREFYLRGMVEKGDAFLRSFEKCPIKSKSNKKIYREILSNKKLYQRKGNSESDGRKILYKTMP